MAAVVDGRGSAAEQLRPFVRPEHLLLLRGIMSNGTYARLPVWAHKQTPQVLPQLEALDNDLESLEKWFELGHKVAKRTRLFLEAAQEMLEGRHPDKRA